MLFLRFLLFVISFGFVGIAIAIVLYDVYLAFELDRLLRRTNDSPPASSPTTSPASSDAEVQASAVPPPQTPGAAYLRPAHRPATRHSLGRGCEITRHRRRPQPLRQKHSRRARRPRRRARQPDLRRPPRHPLRRNAPRHSAR